MSRNIGAGGYNPANGGFFSPPVITTKIVQGYMQCALTPQIANSNFLSDEELFCGSQVVFGRTTDIDFFSADKDNNEAPYIINDIGIKSDTLTICQSEQFEIKLSHIDKRAMCSRYDEWLRNLNTQLDKAIVKLVDAYSIPKILASASPDNIGRHAGKITHAYDLGDQQSNPLKGNTVEGMKDLLLTLQAVAIETDMSCAEGEAAIDGEEANPVILVPLQLRNVLIKALQGLDSCCSDNSAMRTGKVGKLYGTDIIVTSKLSGYDFGAGKVAPVVLTDPSRTLHAFDVITSKTWEGKFEDYLVGEFIYDTHVIDPHSVAIAYSVV